MPLENSEYNMPRFTFQPFSLSFTGQVNPYKKNNFDTRLFGAGEITPWRILSK